MLKFKSDMTKFCFQYFQVLKQGPLDRIMNLSIGLLEAFKTVYHDRRWLKIKVWSRNFLIENFFGRKFFFCKIISSTNSLDKKKSWSKNFLVEIFFLSKFFFFFDGKIFFGRKFFCCNIITSETVWMKKNLVEIVLLSKNFFARKFFCLQNHLLGNGLDEKNLGRKVFWSKIFLLHNHFPGNSLEEKILVEIFFVENFFVAASFLLKQFG